MIFYEKIKAICEKYEDVSFFIDMDGTIAEYEFFTKEYRENNKDGLFINIRPLKGVINCLKKINTDFPNIKLYILSLCKFNSDSLQKLDWLSRHAPFIKKDNTFILTRENGDYTPETIGEVKAEFIKKMISSDEHVVFLEDTHVNMKNAKDLLEEQVSVFHISSFIE